MKRNVYVFILLFIALSFMVSAQNLVPNFSFEDTIHCPNENWVNGWVTSWYGGGTCLYENAYCYNTVPANETGYQYAHSGKAYAQIASYISGEKDSRGYLQAQLTSMLLAGTKYYVTFWVNLPDSFKNACNNMGAYLSDSALVFSAMWPNAKPYLTPQVANDTTNHLTDKINWMKISGSFIAKGGEQYIIIGNFNSDAQSDTMFVGSGGKTTYNWKDAYYYVDDVIVTADSNYADSLFNAVNELKAVSERVKVFPNPSNGKFSVEVFGARDKEYIEIYNVLGERIYQTVLNSGTTQIDLCNHPKGLYLYRVVTSNGGQISQGKFIIQ